MATEVDLILLLSYFIIKEKDMAYSTDLRKIKKESRIIFFGASSKGGQRANRKKIGVRIFHIPSGIKARSIEERSQVQNLDRTLERLQKKLKKLNEPRKKRIPTRPGKASKIRKMEWKKKRARGKKLRQKPEIF